MMMWFSRKDGQLACWAVDSSNPSAVPFRIGRCNALTPVLIEREKERSDSSHPGPTRRDQQICCCLLHLITLVSSHNGRRLFFFLNPKCPVHLVTDSSWPAAYADELSSTSSKAISFFSIPLRKSNSHCCQMDERKKRKEEGPRIHHGRLHGGPLCCGPVHPCGTERGSWPPTEPPKCARVVDVARPSDSVEPSIALSIKTKNTKQNPHQR